MLTQQASGVFGLGFGRSIVLGKCKENRHWSGLSHRYDWKPSLIVSLLIRSRNVLVWKVRSSDFPHREFVNFPACLGRVIDGFGELVD